MNLQPVGDNPIGFGPTDNFEIGGVSGFGVFPSNKVVHILGPPKVASIDNLPRAANSRHGIERPRSCAPVSTKLTIAERLNLHIKENLAIAEATMLLEVVAGGIDLPLAEAHLGKDSAGERLIVSAAAGEPHVLVRSAEITCARSSQADAEFIPLRMLGRHDR